MADVETDDVIEMSQKMRFNATDDVINVWQSKITDAQGGTKEELLIWVEEYIGAQFGFIKSSLSSQLALVEAIVDNLTQSAFMGQVIFEESGEDEGDPLPPQNCGLIVARTSTKSVDGRKYIGVIGEAHQSGGIWGAGVLGEMASMGTAWGLEFTSSNSVVGIGVIVTKSPDDPPVAHSITGTRVITGVRTQRRRTLGRGS